MERPEAKLNTGLTSEQVAEKIAGGFANGDFGVKTRSYKQIVKDNLLSLFNLINVLLLICIILSGSWKNALFFLVVIWNFGIGVFQEIRAKQTIEKLSLISSPSADVVRDGRLTRIAAKDIVLGDIMQLNLGNQICCDSVILKGSCQVNESLVTGESEPVHKGEGDHLLSGSFLIQGSVYAEAEHVGAENYVNRITCEAGSMKNKESVIMHSVRSIVRVIAICILPLAGLLVWNNFFRLDQDFSTAMVKTVAAISSMIPGGLVFLVSVVLAVSVVRLAAHNTLVQDLYSVEHLARVDMLLLDKTGTITSGNLCTQEIRVLSETFADRNTISLLAYYCAQTKDRNATIDAVRTYLDGFGQNRQGFAVHIPEQDPGLVIPFSSEKKWGLVYLEQYGSLILGAPDQILKRQNIPVESVVKEYAEKGKRVVLFAVSDKKCPDPEDPLIPEDAVPAALIIMDDEIRPDAKETFGYFREEGVAIKVISGDAPLTVSRIAQQAGIEHALDYTDASQLDDDALTRAVNDYTVFGRVKPDQKLKIVRALQEQGHVVAMTGDGANDVLALRGADCSIAMQSGSDAARYAANIVLLDSNFSSLPLVVAEGRKAINNLCRSASLYLTKTVYSFIFAVFFIIATYIAYPFENIQVTLIGAVSIGIPSFFLALEPNRERVKGRFLKKVFEAALPAGILEASALIILSGVLKKYTGADSAQISTAATYLMLIQGIIVVLGIAGKLRLWKAVMAALLCAFAAGAALLFPGLFSFVPLDGRIYACVLISAAGFAAVFLLVSRLLVPVISRYLDIRYFHG